MKFRIYIGLKGYVIKFYWNLLSELFNVIFFIFFLFIFMTSFTQQCVDVSYNKNKNNLNRSILHFTVTSFVTRARRKESFSCLVSWRLLPYLLLWVLLEQQFYTFRWCIAWNETNWQRGCIKIESVDIERGYMRNEFVEWG